MDPVTAPIFVHAADPDRLARIRAEGHDGHGNALRPYAASGDGEPLRCCLRYAHAGERIALISYANFEHASPWTEVGPVYVHADACPGYAHPDELPTELAHGPRVLRTYRADHTMNYAHNTVVTESRPIGPIIDSLLGEPEVAIVHVRTLAPQCYLYAVSARR